MNRSSGEGVSFSLFRIAAPVVFQGLVLQFQVLIDRAFLGRLGSEYFSAVGNAIFPYYATTEVLMALSLGATIVISHKIGARDFDGAKAYAEAAVKYGSIVSLLLFIGWFELSEHIFRLLGVQPPILEYSVRFVRCLSIYLVTFGIELSINSILQGVGYTSPMMYIGLARNAMNVLLDWLLIFGNCGAPRLELEGAALATSISNVMAVPVCLAIVMRSKRMPFRLRLSEVVRAKWKTCEDMIRVGVPASLESLLWQIGNLAILRFANALDFMAAGIYTLLFSIEICPFCVYLGIAKANLTLVGQKTGAKEDGLINGINTKSLFCSVCVSSVLACVFLCLPSPILNIFTDDSSVIGRASPFFVILSLNMIARSVNVVVGHGIRGLGDTKWMLHTQVFGSALVVGMSFLLVFVFRLNLFGIFLAVVSDEAIRAVINLIRFYGRDLFRSRRFAA